MRRSSPALLLVLALGAAGCEALFSDVATRVRYALVRAEADLGPAVGSTHTFTVDPDRWPDGCGGKGFRLTLIPYRGGKQVPVGDVDVRCADGHPYWTGFGSPTITLAQELSVAKGPGESVSITLRRTTSGVEIVALR